MTETPEEKLSKLSKVEFVEKMFAKKQKPKRGGSNATNPYLLASQGIQVRFRCYGYTSFYINSPFQHSVQFQEARIREYAQNNNHDFIGIYSDNNIRSEEVGDHVELRRLMMVLEPHDIIVIYNISRLAPDFFKIIEFRDFFIDSHIQLVSLDQNIDLKTAAGKSMFGFMANMAQYEYDLYRETQARNLQNN